VGAGKRGKIVLPVVIIFSSRGECYTKKKGRGGGWKKGDLTKGRNAKERKGMAGKFRD